MHFLLCALAALAVARCKNLQEPEAECVRAISVKELEHLHNFMSILNLEPKFRHCKVQAGRIVCMHATVEVKPCVCCVSHGP